MYRPGVKMLPAGFSFKQLISSMKFVLNHKITRILLLVIGLGLVALLYWVLLTALPKYAGRVPFLVLLFMIDWLIYRDIRKYWNKSSLGVKNAFALCWWAPLVLLFLFLAGTAIWPLQQWNSWLRIYIPGIALVAFLSKFAMFVGLIPAFLLQIVSFISGVGRLEKRVTFKRTVRFFRGSGILLGSLVFGLLFIGCIYWVYDFKIHEINVKVKDLPEEFEGLKIVQLSDIHIGSWVSKVPLQQAVDQVLALKPDLIVFTGDMVNFSSGEEKGFEDIFAQLKAPLGVVAILGNHDYGDYVAWENDADKKQNLIGLETFYQRIGWKLLRNQSIVIRKDSVLLLLAGVENWSATSRFRKYGDMKLTMENTPKADVNILLSHDPTHWDAEIIGSYPQFDLTLSGHTHGMQLGLETAGIKWSPAQYIYKEWAGLYSHESASGKVNYLYVNRGLGHIGYPGRVGILPEITLITLVKAL